MFDDSWRSGVNRQPDTCAPELQKSGANLAGEGARATHTAKKARPFSRAFLQTGNYLVSLPGEAVNSFGLAMGRAVRLDSVGAAAAAP